MNLPRRKMAVEHTDKTSEPTRATRAKKGVSSKFKGVSVAGHGV